jgi:DUF4097 and DUF4098 domain-containing protein YvlB
MRTEVFSTPEPPRLRVNLPAGRVRVETADTAETRVELDGPHEAEALIELRGDEVVVDVERRKLLGRGRNHELVIQTPHGAALDATTASADLEGRGRLSRFEAKTASGDVAVQQVEGDARVKTASGDVIFQAVGGAFDVNAASGDVIVKRVGGGGSVRSASGDVIVGEAEGDLKVQTASGDQEIRSIAQGEVTLQSASGDISVGIRRGSKLWVDANSMSGDTTSELELSDTPGASDGPLVELRATSMSGDVTIKRA